MRTVSASAVIDDELALLDVVAERNVAAHPHALGFGRGDLVADSFARDLTLELGEGEQHVEREAAHRGCGVERLRHRNERGAVRVQHIDDLREISERPSQPVDLVDDDNLHFAGRDVAEQPLQRRTFHGAARKPSVVVEIWQCRPAGMLLAET